MRGGSLGCPERLSVSGVAAQPQQNRRTSLRASATDGPTTQRLSQGAWGHMYSYRPAPNFRPELGRKVDNEFLRTRLADSAAAGSTSPWAPSTGTSTPPPVYERRVLASSRAHGRSTPLTPTGPEHPSASARLGNMKPSAPGVRRIDLGDRCRGNPAPGDIVCRSTTAGQRDGCRTIRSHRRNSAPPSVLQGR